ncbi:MAG TPA: MerR family transcriptional regulator [Terriglobales bacterium]|nr:MerR family transcriptional regulator [Terriglobales bacterium]
MLRVSEIAKRSGLSRTTILYYESCGLLKPALRSSARYRLYGDRELRILDQIRLYRSVGMSVRDIRLLLGSPESEAAALLKRRLRELETEIGELRGHQAAILRLLRSKDILRRTKDMTKDKWVSIMKSAGFSEDDMHRWHREFERAAPEDHQEFLHYLHIPEQEIRDIRQWSKKTS